MFGNSSSPRQVYNAYLTDLMQQIGRAKQRGQMSRDSLCVDVSDLQNPYGVPGLFDPCGGNDLISLCMAGSDPFLDALGWFPSDTYRIIRPYLTWLGSEGQNGADGPVEDGWVEDCCDDRDGISYGVCRFMQEDFATIGAKTGGVCIYNDIDECENDQVRLFDGSPVTNNLQFQSVLAARKNLQTLRRMVIHGDSAVDGQFDGLIKILTTPTIDYKTGEECAALNPITIDWGGNGCYVEDGMPATWTDPKGTHMFPSNASIMDALHWILLSTKHKLMAAESMAMQNMQPGDIFLLVNPNDAECLKQCLMCWQLCAAGDCPNSVIWAKDGKEFRNEMSGGVFGFGQLPIYDMILPMVEYSNIPQGDMVVLTRSVGSQRMVWGEFQNMTRPASNNPDRYMVTDGNRFLTYEQTRNTCEARVVDHRPRLRYDGKWASTYITGFNCSNGLPNRIPDYCDPVNPDFYLPYPLAAATGN